MNKIDPKIHSWHENLEILADFLEKERPNVGMGEFFVHEGVGADIDEFRAIEKQGEHLCGTAACGLGWAAVIFDVTSTDWYGVSNEVFGLPFSSDQAQFLFSAEWGCYQEGEVELEELIARIRLFLVDLKVPQNFWINDYKTRYARRGRK